MQKLSKINEDVLTDIIMRNRKGGLRKEEIIRPESLEELKEIINERYDGGKELDLTNIDVSMVDSFAHLFSYFGSIKSINLTGWKTGNVKSMYDMFYKCCNLEEIKGIEDFDTSSVTDMCGVFYGCEKLNQPLDSWNVGSVTDMSYMFCGCQNFNQPLDSWNVSNVNDMHYMFYECQNFDQPLDLWNVRKVSNMCYMFCGCQNFDQPLDSWNVKNMTDVDNIFLDCKMEKSGNLPEWINQR